MAPCESFAEFWFCFQLPYCLQHELQQKQVPISLTTKFVGKFFHCYSVIRYAMPTDSSTYHDSRSIVPCAIICSDHFVWIWMRVKWNFHHIQIKGVYGPINQTFCIQKSRCSYLNSTNQMSSQCYIFYNIANIMKPRNLCYDFIIIQSDFILELITRFDKCPSWWWFNPWKEVIFTNMCFRFHSSQQSEHNISTKVFVWAISTNKHNEKILLRPGVFSAVKLSWIFPGAPLTFNGAPGNIQGNLGRYVGVSSIHSLCSAKVFVVRAVQQHSTELMSHLPSDSAEQNRKWYYWRKRFPHHRPFVEVCCWKTWII